jgi:RHS repeat-associated protein
MVSVYQLDAVAGTYKFYINSEYESKEGELTITGYVAGGNTEDRSQKINQKSNSKNQNLGEEEQSPIINQQLAISEQSEIINQQSEIKEGLATGDSKTLSDGLFPPEEQMPVPPPSMYRGITTLVTRYLYTGREYNIETGLYYYRARVMNPGHGRFISKDRINYINLYYYLFNMPLLKKDPFGLGVNPYSGWECWSLIQEFDAKKSLYETNKEQCEAGDQDACDLAEEFYDDLEKIERAFEDQGCGAITSPEEKADMVKDYLSIASFIPILGIGAWLIEKFAIPERIGEWEIHIKRERSAEYPEWWEPGWN